MSRKLSHRRENINGAGARKLLTDKQNRVWSKRVGRTESWPNETQPEAVGVNSTGF